MNTPGTAQLLKAKHDTAARILTEIDSTFLDSLMKLSYDKFVLSNRPYQYQSGISYPIRDRALALVG